MTLKDRLTKFAEFHRQHWPTASSEEVYKTRGAREENARLKPALVEAAKLVEALEWIANFEEDSLDSSDTLHYDMKQKVKSTLAAFDQALKDIEGARCFLCGETKTWEMADCRRCDCPRSEGT